MGQRRQVRHPVRIFWKCDEAYILNGKKCKLFACPTASIRCFMTKALERNLRSNRWERWNKQNAKCYTVLCTVVEYLLVMSGRALLFAYEPTGITPKIIIHSLVEGKAQPFFDSTEYSLIRDCYGVIGIHWKQTIAISPTIPSWYIDSGVLHF